MLNRLLQLPKDQHLFLLGARGTGKTTLLQQQFGKENTLLISFLDPSQENRFVSQPNELRAVIISMPTHQTHIILDEIQKVPALLDVVHALIQEKIPLGRYEYLFKKAPVPMVKSLNTLLFSSARN